MTIWVSPIFFFKNALVSKEVFNVVFFENETESKRENIEINSKARSFIKFVTLILGSGIKNLGHK